MTNGVERFSYELKNLVNFFVNIQTTKTKEEAFLKGVLFGSGAHIACPTPNWEFMKQSPTFIDIEREIREVFEKIHKRRLEEARKLLEEIKERNA